MIDLLINQAAALPSEQFDPTHPRVSRISECARSHVGSMLGMFSRPFPAYYRIAGKALEDAYANELRRIGRPVTQGRAIPTSVIRDGEPVECHLDIVVTMGDGTVTVAECKTVDDDKVAKLVEEGAPKRNAIEQATLQWKYAAEAGHDFSRFGVLALGRQSFGFRRAWFPLQYDAQLARRLDTKFLSLEEHYQRGELPPKPFNRPTAECKWGDTECALYKMCWF